MTLLKNNPILAAIFTAVFCLIIPAMATGQNNIVGKTQTDTISKLKSAPTIEKRFVFLHGDCGCLLPYDPDVEYVWMPRHYSPVPQLPWSVFEQYTSDKVSYEKRKLSSIVDIEEVDGIKIIKKHNGNEYREEYLQPAEGGAETHRRGE